MSSRFGITITKTFKNLVMLSYGNLLTKPILNDISKVYKVPIFNINDYIFQLISSKEKSKTINYLRECVKFKKKIEDWAIFTIIQRRLSQEEEAKGIIFDSFPKKLSQILILNTILERKIVLKLDVDPSILTEILSGRRECPKCRKEYFINNINKGDFLFNSSLPKEDIKKCDKCNILLIHQEKDKLESVQKQIEKTKNLLMPLFQYYQKNIRMIERQITKENEKCEFIKNDLDNFFTNEIESKNK